MSNSSSSNLIAPGSLVSSPNANTNHIPTGIDHSRMKLGRQAAFHDPHRRAASDQLFHKILLPLPPIEVTWSGGRTSWGEMVNDQLADCTIAGLGHAVQVTTRSVADIDATPSDATIISYYEKWCGYNPSNPATDEGAVENSVLQKCLQEGFAGHKLLNYVSPAASDITRIKQAIMHFGYVYMGAELPISAQSQQVWDVVGKAGDGSDGGVWGGHCMIAVAYDADTVTFVTWGELKKATWAWWSRYVDEAHILIFSEWLQHYPEDAREAVMNILTSLN